MKKIFSFVCSLVLLTTLFTSCSPVPTTPDNQTITSDSIKSIITKYRQEILQHTQSDNIPGLAIAVVDNQSVLWQEGFGYTDWNSKISVTPSTLFSIQSMSKSFTATAAMFAAQDGLVDLDAPITKYLPDFHVNSIFEEHPEQKMTLRILLSHTAGFAHDTGYGNNNDHPPYDLQKHIDSISDNWLMFPVGTRFSYSNVGIDLAGYILQTQSGEPFTQYVKETVFQPLGMNNSTMDYTQVRDDHSRAIGHIDGPIQPPVDFMLIASGGVWTNVKDMARYLQFHINKGALDGNRLLREDLAETMYTVPNAPARTAYGYTGYALGITVDTRNGARHFQHGGGGFGFNSSMVWYPELGLGSVVLTNSNISGEYYYQLSEDVLDSIIAEHVNLYLQRNKSATIVSPAYPPLVDQAILSDPGLASLIASKALPQDESAQQRAVSTAGEYIATSLGFPADTGTVKYLNEKLSLTYFGNTSPLIEIEPGLYFTPYGNSFITTGDSPTLDNVEVIKANTHAGPAIHAFYILCGLLFAITVIALPVLLVVWLIRRKRNSKLELAGPQPTARWLIAAGALLFLAALFGVLVLFITRLMPDLIYVPWPLPYVDLKFPWFFIFCVPIISLVLAILIAIITVSLMARQSTKRFLPAVFLVLGAFMMAFNLIVLI